MLAVDQLTTYYHQFAVQQTKVICTDSFANLFAITGDNVYSRKNGQATDIGKTAFYIGFPIYQNADLVRFPKKHIFLSYIVPELWHGTLSLRTSSVNFEANARHSMYLKPCK